MSLFQRIIAFVLGLFVVILIAVVATNRFNIRERLQSAITNGNAQDSNPTPTQIPTQIPSPTGNVQPTVRQPTTTATIRPKPQAGAIPNTGSPTILIPLASAIFGLGVLLRRVR